MRHTIVANNQSFDLLFSYWPEDFYTGTVEIEEALDITGVDRTEEFIEHFLTPEIEEALSKYYLENYDPTPYE